MTDKDIQDLIRLKRHEKPEDGYFDDFLVEFQQRQRSELLNTSARGLFLERVKTWFSEQVALKWVAGAGVAYATVALTLSMMSSSDTSNNGVVADQSAHTGSSITQLPASSAPQSGIQPVSMEMQRPVDFSGKLEFADDGRVF